MDEARWSQPPVGRRAAALAAVAVAVLAWGCTLSLPAPPPAGTATPPSASSASTHASIETEVHQLVNRHRAARGQPPLAYDERVAAIARRHSEAMAAGRRAFGHDGFDARSEEVASIIPLRLFAENVLYDSRAPVAQRAVENWLASRGHRQNIEGAFDLTGVGVARSPGGVFYLTQLFVARRQ